MLFSMKGGNRLFAEVIVDIAHANVDRVFAYEVPSGLELCIGQRVLVPFGRGNAAKEGYVIALCEQTQFPPEKIKSILGLAEGFAALLPEQIRLASWMAKKYRCLMVDALRLMIPAQIRGDRVHEKTLGVARLCLEGEALQAALSRLRGEDGGRKAPAQQRTAELLLQVGCMAVSDLYAFLPEARGALPQLKKKGLVCVEDRAVRRTPYEDIRKQAQHRPVLTQQQCEALVTIERAVQAGDQTVLLHGVTGSGKTEVYLRAIEHVLDAGGGAIVLVPEISLTPQMVARFRGRLGDTVAVMHSRLSAGERYDEWRRVRNGQARVVIGPRSALFTPVQDIGLIVIDEEHEQSYRNEQRPQFEAVDIARFRARQSGGTVVLGSATPSVQSYYRCQNGDYRLCQMPARVGESGMPKVVVADMREELQQGNRSIFSGPLYQAIEDTLVRGEQIMLFINRRGYSTFLMCRGCGYVFECPSCDVSMTFHKGRNNDWLACHYCGHTQSIPKVCPACGKPYLKYFGMGTQQVEEQVHLHFPKARTLRMDADTTRGKDAHLHILEAFGAHKADVLIGTQMIAKGLDFQNVTLVGVMAADSSLYLPDYRSAERTFQLIMQVAGRAGRDVLPGHVVVQTYNPEHFAVQAAVEQDYQAFYAQEIQYRRMAQFPPFATFVQFLFRGEEKACREALDESRAVVERLLHRFDTTPLQMECGPAPISRIKGETRLRILLKLCCDARTETLVDALYTQFHGVSFSQCTLSMETNPSNML